MIIDDYDVQNTYDSRKNLINSENRKEIEKNIK